MNARRLIRVIPLLFAVIPIAALAKDCNEVKAEIDAKIKAKGVPSYFLEIVDASSEGQGKVVGTCGGGTKNIVYRKDEPAENPKQSQETSNPS
jgi:hypothetical protein